MKKLRFVKISWQKFERDCLVLSKKLKDLKIDKIVAISRGGLVAARIFSDLLEIAISHITIASYQNIEKLKEPVITEVPTKTFEDETILIVDEVSDSGKTFKRAFSYFKNFPVRKIYTLSLYIKSKTKFVPDFYQKKINAWIIFPYEVKETATAFKKMFKNKKKTKAKLLQLGFKKWEIEEIV